VKQAIEALKVTLEAKAGDTGRLFGSITASDLADAVKAAGGPLVDKRKVTIAEHVKTVGKYNATVVVHEGVTAKLHFEVVAG
jgi:large subunit ribosomal protein L9